MGSIQSGAPSLLPENKLAQVVCIVELRDMEQIKGTLMLGFKLHKETIWSAHQILEVAHVYYILYDWKQVPKQRICS